jgi:hypothetical protein
MKKPCRESDEPLHDRALLLHGEKRNELLTLEEIQGYGSDSFSDPDYIRLYGMTPPQWYAHGIRLLGRTAVECTGDPLADRIGRDVAAVAASLPVETPLVYLFFITDGETTGRFIRDEYCVAHLPARSVVLGLDLFPEPQSSQLELRKLLSDFPPQAIFFGFAPSLATSRKHPQMVTSSSYQQYTPAFCCNEFR